MSSPSLYGHGHGQPYMYQQYAGEQPQDNGGQLRSSTNMYNNNAGYVRTQQKSFSYQ